MRTLKKTVYSFDELSDTAKEKAREWWRNGGLDHEWYDGVFEDAKTIGALMGIEISNIYFSGFSSQGDGAQFEGHYSYKSGSVKAVKEYAPIDKELHKIAARLQEIQRPAFYQLTANVKHSGHYYHEMNTQIDVDRKDGSGASTDEDDNITDALRDFMRWIYRSLEREYDYLNADEQVDESIRINEYEFDEDGNRA